MSKTTKDLTRTQQQAASRKPGLTKEQANEWHRQHPTPAILTPTERDALMKKLGVTKEQDAEWHRTHYLAPGRGHA